MMKTMTIAITIMIIELSSFFSGAAGDSPQELYLDVLPDSGYQNVDPHQPRHITAYHKSSPAKSHNTKPHSTPKNKPKKSPKPKPPKLKKPGKSQEPDKEHQDIAIGQGEDRAYQALEHPTKPTSTPEESKEYQQLALWPPNIGKPDTKPKPKPNAKKAKTDTAKESAPATNVTNSPMLGYSKNNAKSPVLSPKNNAKPPVLAPKYKSPKPERKPDINAAENGDTRPKVDPETQSRPNPSYANLGPVPKLPVAPPAQQRVQKTEGSGGVSSPQPKKKPLGGIRVM